MSDQTIGRFVRARRWRPATLVTAALLCLCAAARADTLTISHVHPVPASGALGVTVGATGPPQTAIALDLFSKSCPAAPRDADFVPGVTAEGQPVELLANPPYPEGAGAFLLCVWLVHDDGQIGAEYQQHVCLPGDGHNCRRAHKPRHAPGRRHRTSKPPKRAGHRARSPLKDKATGLAPA